MIKDLTQIQFFGDLEQGKEYVVEFGDSPDIQHIKVIFKGVNVSLIEVVDPNDKETLRKWVNNHSNPDFEETNSLYCVHEELTGFTRSNKIDDIIGNKDEK